MREFITDLWKSWKNWIPNVKGDKIMIPILLCAAIVFILSIGMIFYNIFCIYSKR